MDAPNQMLKLISLVIVLNMKSTTGTMNLAPGKSLSFSDGWIIIGNLFKTVDNSVRRCAVFEAKQNNNEEFWITLDLQNLTKVTFVDIKTDDKIQLVRFFNNSLTPDSDVFCEVDKDCYATGQILLFESEKRIGRIEICEIKAFGCPVGFYGDSCLDVCRCFGDCDPDSGHCDGQCHDGWTGGSCDIPCPDGTYGNNCSQTCTGHCFGNVPCNRVTGNCQSGCSDGWTGPKCATEMQSPLTSEMTLETSLALLGSGVFILCIFGVFLYCLLKKPSKSENGDAEEPNVARRFVRSIGGLKSSVVKRLSRNDKDKDGEGIAKHDSLASAEYIDIVEDNRKESTQSVPKHNNILSNIVTKKNKNVAEPHYQDLLKNEEITDVHLYDKKDTIASSSHQCKIHVTKTQSQTYGNQSAIKNVHKDKNNKKAAIVLPNRQISLPTKTSQNNIADSTNLYLDPVEIKTPNSGHKIQKKALVPNARSFQNRKDKFNMKTTEPVYDLPENQYDYIETGEKPSGGYKRVYPDLIPNGIKLPSLR